MNIALSLLTHEVSRTLNGKVHPSKLQRTYDLPLHVTLIVDEESGQITVGVVGYAGSRDALEELGGWKLGSQLSEVLIDQSTEWDSGGVVKDH